MTSFRKILCFFILGLAIASFGASAADAPKKPSGTVSINETQSWHFGCSPSRLIGQLFTGNMILPKLFL